ncbi:MAG: hypothetical protein A2496_04490 [Burkholderiales bacterium RIFOXYC12_FULL_60_6]|nr:MAG: hypothetical protein A2496_04490 [Burkholderiales bacterium RIFOXYC12_FULL_60_6]
MGQPSSIARLPEDILAKLQELLRDPRVTQLEATGKINEILAADGHPERVTKSAVNRYSLKMEEVGAKIRQSREMADMWIGKFGAAPQGQVGLLITETLRTLAYELTMKLQDAAIDDPETMAATISQLKALSLAVQRLEASTTLNVKREAEIRKQALARAAENVVSEAKRQGTSAASIDALRAAIMTELAS